MAPFCLRRALRLAERFLIAKIYDLCGLPLMWLRFCVFLLSRGKKPEFVFDSVYPFFVVRIGISVRHPWLI